MKTYSKFSIKGLPAGATAGIPGIGGWNQATWTGASSPDPSGIPPLLPGDLSNPAGITNPASLLGLLRAQASSVQSLGGEVLDGINTTHYRAIIPLSRLGAGTAEAEQILGTDSISVDYWIDSSHLLRQLRFAIAILRQPSDTTSSPGEVTAPSDAYPMTVSASLQLSHYGTPVHIVPPSSAQITNRETCVASGGGFSCTG
jgi:hypothetical protein